MGRLLQGMDTLLDLLALKCAQQKTARKGRDKSIAFVHGNATEGDDVRLILPGGEEVREPLAGYVPPHGSPLDLRVNRYQRAKARSLQMLAYMQGLLDKTPQDSLRYRPLSRQIERLRACGTWLCFHYYYGWPEGKFQDQYRLVQANFCNQHLRCNFCAIRWAVVKLRVYFERFEHLMAQQPLLTPHLITLTVKNGPDLLERFNHLRKSYDILQQRRRNYLTRSNKKNYAYTQFAKIMAGAGNFEFTYNHRCREYHPHLHLICLVNGRIHQLSLVEEWRDIAGDSFIVDARPFTTPDEPLKAFQEVFKYALKFSSMPIEVNHQAAELLRRKRLFVSFGDFWGLEVPDKLTDDPLEQNYVEYLYEWITNQYILQQVRHVEKE